MSTVTVTSLTYDTPSLFVVLFASKSYASMIGAMHGRESGGGESSPEFRVGSLMQIFVPQIFKKYRSEFCTTRHVKRKIHVFLGRGLPPSQNPPPMDPTLAPN